MAINKNPSRRQRAASMNWIMRPSYLRFATGRNMTKDSKADHSRWLGHDVSGAVAWGRVVLWPQCLKCRMPVNTMASFSLSAAAITSSSRTDPPG